MPNERALLERYRAEARPLLDEAAIAARRQLWGRGRFGDELLERAPHRAIAVLVGALTDDGVGTLVAEDLASRPLPYTSDDAALLVWLLERGGAGWRALQCARAAGKAIETRALAGDDVSELVRRLNAAAAGSHDYGTTDWTRIAARLRKLVAVGGTLDLAALRADDPWSTQARPVLTERFAAQGPLLAHLATATQSKPTKRWLATVEPLLDEQGRELVRYLAESAAETEAQKQDSFVYEGVTYYRWLWLSDMSATVLRGALWAATLLDDGDWVAPVCERLIERSRRPEQLKVSNACFVCLGERGDDDAVLVLSRIVAQVKDRRYLKPAERALERAAERRGLSRDALRERLVPDFGLDGDGAVRVQVGPFEGTLSLVPPAAVVASFAVPAQAREEHREDAAVVKRLTAEVRKELGLQRVRLENMLAADRTWDAADWRAYYLEHPLVQLFARGLIWSFDAHAALPISRDRFLTLSGETEPPQATEVKLWHPLHAPADEVAGWRTLLREREIRQPFKQAYREMYLLAPAEQQTGVYSNRFAAHIVRYPQVYALAKQRGWGIRALGPYDNGGGEQWRDFPEQGLRACFWMEHAGGDWNTLGAIADLASTDQVRFTRPGSEVPVPLEEVPPLVFSEAMRDVDLFVGVASIAADPTWLDGGVNRFNAYWHDHAFGELTESAELRRDALRELLPGLKVADRLEVDERWLRVRGNLNTYRIHLGSANIMIEPDDRFLCIVPNRRRSLGAVYLPFEDDRLSEIISKALLLVQDDAISDPTITRQLR